MNEDEHDIELRERLRELGRRPIDAGTRELHMRRMDATAASGEPRRRGFVWAGIAAAAVVGFMAGSTGLAMADALPNRAQDVAHDVLGAVQVDVPAGKEGKRGPCVSEAAKIKDKDAKKAAMEACPKGGHDGTDDDSTGPEGSPGKSGDAPGHSGDTPGHPDGAPGKSGSAPGQVKHAGDPCHGRPPWAGPMSKEQRDAAKQAASRDACPPDADDSSSAADADSTHDVDEVSETSAPISPDATTTTSTVPSGDASSTSGESSEE